MTCLLDAAALEGRLTQEVARRAVEHSFVLEAAGCTLVPTRMDVPSKSGFLRVMPAVLSDVMGLKVMTLVHGLGTRYVVLLHTVESGELLAIVDADELTRIRTGATTAVAAGLMVSEPPRQVGMLGSGFEAVGQLRALSALWPDLDVVRVFSPNRQRCTRFAQMMSEELHLEVKPVGSAVDAIADQTVIVLATKAVDPVLDGSSLARGTVVLSIGSTRPDLRELDRATLARAGTLVADAPEQLPSESGDIADALQCGILEMDDIISVAALSAGKAKLQTDDDRDLLVFKSVGTALQDLAIARAAYDDAMANGHGVSVPSVASLKPFAEQ